MPPSPFPFHFGWADYGLDLPNDTNDRYNFFETQSCQFVLTMKNVIRIQRFVLQMALKKYSISISKGANHFFSPPNILRRPFDIKSV
jgi:hypothetical protein